MKQIYPDLWQTSPEHPFGPQMSTHAYFLTRGTGNVLFYSSGHLHEHQHILKLGGIARQYLSHRDEAGPALVRIKQTFGSKLCCHKLEEEAIRAACPVDLTFENREFHLGDIEVIPTPGHTEGSACFMYKSSHGNTYLFTGDTIFPKDDSWGTYVSNEHERTLKQSLELLGNLKPSVVISSASVGPFSFKQVLPGEWQAIVNGAIRSLS